MHADWWSMLVSWAEIEARRRTPFVEGHDFDRGIAVTLDSFCWFCSTSSFLLSGQCSLLIQTRQNYFGHTVNDWVWIKANDIPKISYYMIYKTLLCLNTVKLWMLGHKQKVLGYAEVYYTLIYSVGTWLLRCFALLVCLQGDLRISFTVSDFSRCMERHLSYDIFRKL